MPPRIFDAALIFHALLQARVYVHEGVILFRRGDYNFRAESSNTDVEGLKEYCLWRGEDLECGSSRQTADQVDSRLKGRRRERRTMGYWR